MTEKRPHADLAIKFYSDTKMRCWRWYWDGSWEDITHPSWHEDDIYEVCEHKPTHKPKKLVTLAGITFNAPESVEPALGTVYWVPAPLSTSNNTVSVRWKDGVFDRCSLERGFVHLDKEDAELHAKALIELSRGLK